MNSKKEIDFFKIEAEKIAEDVITGLEQGVSEPLYPGDERRIYGEAIAFLLVLLLNSCNEQARQSLLRYAKGEVLDAMGERVSTYRLKPQKANTMLRFMVDTPIDRNIVIPERTKVKIDSEVFFETTKTNILLSGEKSVDVYAEATITGTKGNGYEVGTTTALVDLIPYISPSVIILETSEGGDDGEEYTEEGDNLYRERIRTAAAKFSTAGPKGAYEYYTYSVDAEIKSVNVISEQKAGTIELVVLMKDGNGPSKTVKERILKIVNDKKIRPMNDWVTVISPTFETYDIEIKYYVTEETESKAVETIEGVEGAITKYIEWQDSAMGRDINPDQLHGYVVSPRWESTDELTGALRIEITKPKFKELSEREIAKFSGNIQVTHEVVKE